jgi:hypothetical protein
VGPPLLLLLHIAKELHQFLVAGLLGVLDVLLVSLDTLQRGAQDAAAASSRAALLVSRR